VVVVVLLAGLLFWFLYVAIPPRDYRLPSSSPDRLRTFFGWRAPGIDAGDPIERDRLWFAVAGWLVVGLVAGRLRPRLWMLIGPLAVLPTLAVYFATAPHDYEGWWRTLNLVCLPMAACAVAGVSRVAPRLDWVFDNVLVLAGSVGAVFAVSLLMGGGESTGAIIGTGLGSGLLVGAVELGRRTLTSAPAFRGFSR
jgi:hypothetical protein